MKKNSKLRPKRKQPWWNKLMAVMGYIVPLCELYHRFYYPLINRWPSIQLITFFFLPAHWYVSVAKKMPFSGPILIYFIYEKMFLRRVHPIIRVPYFVRHHMLHAIGIPLHWTLVQHIASCFIDSKNKYALCNGMLIIAIINTISLLPLTFWAARGLYLEIPYFSAKTEGHIGPFPSEELEIIDTEGNVVDETPKSSRWGLYVPRFVEDYEQTKLDKLMVDNYFLDMDILEDEINDPNNNIIDVDYYYEPDFDKIEEYFDDIYGYEKKKKNQQKKDNFPEDTINFEDFDDPDYFDL